ncbi:cobalt-precorrin-5B (C(1))-methyltransferase CbiD [Desulfoscipio gibsoniae]|uniref:Cobalt-precorrin-5B C(1)-methyltransferase n=1 Tax=Desulfoscipio gibsoniae DSM 7213 TaxID=767817 RepID=R4KLP1_9FIRM|nr:cobalt-precorrin-5B (C(1))-methyltransferase CbiD [Desulfoscipio gibsoniae]AGL01470.1 cobalt-precorrin 5B C1-methyltransferase [Desulfoscipio gibsoniae DSM 7213]
MTGNQKLKSGISTGACAAAAAKAAALALFKNKYHNQLTVTNPQGRKITVPINRYIKIPDGQGAVVIKDGGDDPDVTHGLEIIASISRTHDGTITIQGGEGVGTVTKPGLQVAVGQSAINPVPLWMINNALAEVIPPDTGCTVTISVPGGEAVARRTLNPRLGIVGGISILGTTGIVRPMSEEAFKNSLLPLIDMAVAHGYDQVVLTPGRMGVRWATNQGLPEKAVVEMSNFVGFMLEGCVARGIKKVLLWGHHGKLIKIAAGIFHTHSKVADARQETLAALAASLGAGPAIVSNVLACTTTEAIVDILTQERLTKVLDLAAQRASARAAIHVQGKLVVGTALLNMKGEVLAADRPARVIGRELGWHISL